LRGAIVAEAQLLDELDAMVRTGVDDLGPLRAPVRVVVPSQSLREHLSMRLVERSGRAVAGVVIQTLHSLALSILERARLGVMAEDALFPVLVRQLARQMPTLRELLDALRNGYSVVEADVADLLDAGFEAVHTDAVLEQIREFARSPHAERAAAVVQVAAAACDQLEKTGVGHRSVLDRRARELLESDPDALLPSRAVFVFGFADATGVQTDLIESLLRRCGARVFIDQPPDPDDPTRPDPGFAFSSRFSARLLDAAGGAPIEYSERRDPDPIGVFCAPGREVETRSVADRIRVLLDAGATPERIGVVARRLDGYRTALRVHFNRLGIPMSGIGERGPATPAGRRIAALQTLLHSGQRTPLDSWLDLLGALPRASGGWSDGLTAEGRADLSLAFHDRGIARLEDIASFKSSSPAKRHPLASALVCARQLGRFLADWPERAELEVHVEALLTLLTEHLRWRAVDVETVELAVAARGGITLDRDDFLLYLERALADVGSVPIGGEGGGVAILSVMEARSRTFDQLFLIGLSRDVFPRPMGEDPLLSDALRRALRSVLPDLPVKREGVDEERYLFAQLLSSSANVAISCPVIDENGRSRPISPLVERLRVTSRIDVPGLWSAGELGAQARSPLRPAHEHALLAGLHGTRDQLAGALRVAIADVGHDITELGAADPADCARARIAVIAEWDPRGDRRCELGPYYGFTGDSDDERDPRRKPLFVTRVEEIAKCPWQTFVGRLLRIAPLRDARADLPAAEPRIVGALVHGVLQEIAAEHLRGDTEDLGAVLRRNPVEIPWPGESKIRELLMRRAESLLRKAGIATPGFDRVIANQALQHLEFARHHGWPGPGSGAGVLGVEIAGSVTVADRSGAEREIRFRADRVDRIDGRLRLVDYKTGKPAATQKGAEYRREAFRKQIARGRALQAVAYAIGAAQLGKARGEETVAEGRYEYLGADTPDHARVAAVDSDDGDLTDVFLEPARAALEVMDFGSFLPRLIDPSSGTEPSFCQSCDVKEACLRGDSGARTRLERWIAANRQPDREARSAAENAALRLIRLGTEP
jgi:RecB family exonuclease/superfamily I DNA/RNA helicase